MSDRIANFVNKFLAWPLPRSVRPDDCVMNRDYPHRIGTNLLTATEARAMFEHALADDPVPSALAELVSLKAIKDSIEQLKTVPNAEHPIVLADRKRLEESYRSRKDAAWKAARRALGLPAEWDMSWIEAEDAAGGVLAAGALATDGGVKESSNG